MASSGTTTTGRWGDISDNVALADDDVSTGRGVIQHEGTTSEVFVSLGFVTSSSMMMTSDTNEDAESPTTGIKD